MEIMEDMGKYERVQNYKEAKDHEHAEKEKLEQAKAKLRERK